MSKRLTSGISVLVAVMMVMTLVLTGCGAIKQAGNSTTTTTAVTTKAATTTEIAKKGPITIKILSPMFAKPFPNGVQEDAVAKALAEKTGVTIDWIVRNSISDWNNYQSIIIASGDLPDLIETDTADATQRGKIFNADAAMSIDELVAKVGPNITKYASEMLKVNKAFKSKNNDGKLYFLSSVVNDDGRTPSNLQGIGQIRWDLYKAIGSPKIASDDDLLNVLKLMQDKFPTTEDGKKCYALTGMFAESGFGAYWPQRLFDTAVPVVTVGNGYYDLRNPEKFISIFDETSPWLRAVKFYNKAYRMGILDRDASTMKFQQYQEKVTAGRVYFSTDQWMSSDLYNTAVKDTHPDRGFEPIWYPLDPEQETISMVYGLQPGGLNDFWIPKGNKNAERIVEFLDYLYTFEGSQLILNGVEGVNWDVVDGKKLLKEDVLQKEKSDVNYTATSGVNKYTNFQGLGASVKDEEGNPMDFRNSAEIRKKNLSEIDKIYDTDNNVTFPGEAFLNNIKFSWDITLQSCVSVADNKDLTAIAAKITTFTDNNYVRLVFAKTEAEFTASLEKYKADYEKLGYSKLLAGQQADYDKKRAIYPVQALK